VLAIGKLADERDRRDAALSLIIIERRLLAVASDDRRFWMAEFAAVLKTQGKYISPVLLELVWRRKRVWSTTGQYHRYWETPPSSD
jgi:hypothetical protein